MSLMKSDRTKAPKSDRIVGYRITPKRMWLNFLAMCLLLLHTPERRESAPNFLSGV